MSQTQEEMRLLDTTENITIKTVRGRNVISTMPDEWVFGRANTLLECSACMTNASWRGVLLGLCEDCAYEYHGKDGLGFPKKEYLHAMPSCSSGAPFGFYCGFGPNVSRKINELITGTMTTISTAIHHDDAYSFYRLAEMKKNSPSDFALLTKSMFGKQNLAFRYNFQEGAAEHEGAAQDEHEGASASEDERWKGIQAVLELLTQEFDPHSLAFFVKCEKMEEQWNECSEAKTQEDVDSQLQVKEEMKAEKKRAKISCQHCGQHIKTLLCSACKSVRYCSVACQHQDWKLGHKDRCKEIIKGKALQAKYNAMMKEADEDKDKLEMENVD